MRVLITGANGQVGHEIMTLAPQGFEVLGLGSRELDITNADLLTATIERLQPQLIINAAAYTAVDKAESEPERAWAVNCAGVANLGLAAAKLGAPVLHISTDYVFAGDADTPYRETDPTAPAGVYGASKLAGEVELAEHCAQHIILRTSWVFGAHGYNFVKTMLRLARERSELSVVADQHGGPTSATSIARALWTLAERYREQGELAWGLYHYSGGPACTWYDFARGIFDAALEQGLLERMPQLNAIPTSAYPTPARRPAWSVLDCRKLQQALGINPADWRDELQAVLRRLG
mgnify:CR=1 FL=1